MSIFLSVPALIVLMLLLIIGTVVFAVSRGRGADVGDQSGTPVLQRKKNKG